MSTFRSTSWRHDSRSVKGSLEWNAMLEKLVIFGIGYVLGTRAGKERFDELVEAAKKFAARDEVQMAVSLATGFLEERFSSAANACAPRDVVSVATQPPRTRAAGASASADGARERLGFAVHGVVQGVGFRPFVWNLATRLELSGSVCNTSGAVIIEVEGNRRALETFAAALRQDAPRLARIDAVEETTLDAVGDQGFRIVESRAVEGDYQPIAPDAATCTECVADILDPGNRRFGYPFTNCTNCGPRFTIIEDIPYDRRLTTMRHFPMCNACRHEYENPADR